MPSTSCAQGCPDPETPTDPQTRPGGSRATVDAAEPRPTRGLTWAAPGQWFFGRLRRGPRQEGGRGEGTREGGGRTGETMKSDARSENREQRSGNKVYPSGRSNTPTTAASTTGFSQPTPLARRGHTPNSCDQFGNRPFDRTAKLSIKPSHALTDQ